MTGAFAISVASLGLLLVHGLVPTPLPIQLRVIGALPGIAAFVLWWRYFAGKEFDRFPFLEYAVTQFYLYWGLATVTLSTRDMPSVAESAWAGAVIASSVVTAAVLVSHPTGRRLGVLVAGALDKCLPRDAPPLRPVIVIPWLAVAATTHANVGAGVIPPNVHHLFNTLGNYVPLLAAIAWRDLLRGRNSATFVACTATLSLAGLLTGMMEAVVQPVLTAITFYVVLRRRVPWRLIGAGALLVVIINPAKHHYRQLAWDPEGSVESRVARNPALAAERWWKAVQAAWTPGASDGADNAAGLAARLDELRVNAVVVEKTPVSVPFDRGRNWGYVALFPVPRFLYPEKPNFTNIYNDRFAIMFGLQTPEATETSTAAFPLVADGYWNFGWPGVLAVGLVTGCIIGFFSGALRARSWAMASIATATFVHLHATSCLAVQIMGVFQRVAGMMVVLWVAWIASHVVDRAIRSLRPERRPFMTSNG